MSNRTTSRSRRIIARLAQAWGEMDYAQRRLLEIRTGIRYTRGATSTASQRPR
jgi:hypothetical protein